MSRYTIDFNRKFDNMLSCVAKDNGVTKAEVIRRAVALYAYLQNELDDNEKLSITSSDSDAVLKDIIIS